MDLIWARFGAPSRLTLCERDMRDETLQFYETVDWGRHEVHFRLGSSGEIKRTRNLQADLILAFHPNIIYDVLLQSLTENLVSGGLVLWQEDFYRNQTSEDLEDVLRMLGRYFEPAFSLIQEPIAGPVVPTYFSRILRTQMVSFLLQRH
jgi:hypothetical protein